MSLVILFCGIPASGKSTLCQAIADRLVEEESINSETEILSFDKFEVNKELWNHETFKTGRQNAIDELSKLLTPKSSSSSSSSTRAPKRKTILVDDIMHLKSMRKQVFQLCRHHSVPLVTVCVSTSLTTALQRNQTRNIDTTVSEESIRKLFDEFEVPDPRFVHDRHVIPIDTTHEPIDTAVERILVTLREAFRDPVKYIPAPLPLLTEHDDHDETVSRVDTESADLLLRKISSALIKAYQFEQTTSDSSHTSTSTNSQLFDVRQLGTALSKAKSISLLTFKTSNRPFSTSVTLSRENQISMFQEEIIRQLLIMSNDNLKNRSEINCSNNISKYISTLFDTIT